MVDVMVNVQWSTDDPYLLHVLSVSVVMVTIGDTTVGGEE